MLDMRNKTAHTYREAMAREVFVGLPNHLSRLTELREALVARVRAIEADTQGPPPDR